MSVESTSAGADGDSQAAGAVAESEETKNVVDPLPTFDDMALSPEVKRALGEMGFVVPMLVQRETFAPLMAGRDLIVQSRTGSGKTAAFGIPFAEGLIHPDDNRVQALVLVPTRELALQVATECRRIAVYRQLQVTAIYGGAPIGKQLSELEAGAQIIAGTPGRVLDHLGRKTLRLGALRVLVLDEADEMLSMGFLEEITEIIKHCPPTEKRQTILFSATIPTDIERIGSRHMRTPEKLELSADHISVEDIKHAYYMVAGMGRTRDLVRLLESERPESAIIFCNTREETGRVAEFLRKSGYDAEAISSDLNQRDRERVMARTKAKNLQFLVATDIAARGIDISDLSHVINYTFPESAEVYVHRTGRTGRAGKSGIAISLVSPRELGSFYMLKLTYKIKPEERFLPSEEEFKRMRSERQLSDLRNLVGAKDVPPEWHDLAKRVMTETDGERIVAALIAERLARARPESSAQALPVAFASEPPSPPLSRPPRSQSASTDGEGRRPRGRRSRTGRGRSERNGAPQGGEARAQAAAVPVAATIDDSGGREFWEAWADSKGDAAPAPPAANALPAPVSSPPPPAMAVPEGMTRLYLNLGRRDRLRPDDVKAFLAEKSVAPDTIDVRSSHTYLLVPSEIAQEVCGKLHSIPYRDRTLVCEPAKK